LQTCRLQRNDSNFEGLLLSTAEGILNTGSASIDTAMNLARRVATLDLEQAGASHMSDKVLISCLVVEEMGSFENLNNYLRHQIREVLLATRSNTNDRFVKLFDLLDAQEHVDFEQFGSSHGNCILGDGVPRELCV